MSPPSTDPAASPSDRGSDVGVPAGGDRRTLHQETGAWSWVWLTVLGTALALQAAGLLLPFMRFAVFIKGGEDYSLLRSISLLWEGGLYVLAALIVGFSLIFPFVKIIVLGWTWLRLPPGPRRTDVLDWMGSLGKWSMLDPLGVLVLVLLATDQWAVAATTYVGVYCFLGAVALTMALSIVASALDAGRRPQPRLEPRRRVSLARTSGRESVAAIVALGLAIALFAGALGFPFLQVDQFLLNDNAYGIANVPVALARGGNWSLALLSGVGLVVLPTVALLAQAWAWIVPATPLSHRRRWQRITWAREWCMLDVMAVAVILFIMEGQGTIRVGVKDGLWLLIAAAAFLGLSGWLGSRAAGVGMQRLEHSGAPSVR